MAVALLAAAVIATSSLNTTGLINAMTDFGARGDGSTNDYTSIQAAIDYARVHSRNGVYFPPGNFRATKPLNFGFWRGIVVQGSGTGDAGIAGATALATMNADLSQPAGACHEFSGAGCGSVSGIFFTGHNCKVMVLNARTSGCGRPLP
jgi:hypothetical protein